MNTKTRLSRALRPHKGKSQNDKYVKLLALISFECVYYKCYEICEQYAILKPCPVHERTAKKTTTINSKGLVFNLLDI